MASQGGEKRVRRAITSLLEAEKAGSQARRQRSEEDRLDAFMRPLPLAHDPRRRAVIGIRSRGCDWFRETGGSCLHCGLYADGIWGDVNSGEIVRSFEERLARVAEERPPIVCLYTAGSFLDTGEVPEEALRSICERIAHETWIDTLVVESEVLFVTPSTIGRLRALLPDKKIQVSIGFDSANTSVRRICLNRRGSLRDYPQACEHLRDAEMIPVLYTVLKPPFLTEREAIDDAIATGSTAFEFGAFAVSLEPTQVQAHTPVARLFEKGLYRPPFLWSVAEVVERLLARGRVTLGGEIIYPAPATAPANCSVCSPRVWAAIRQACLRRDASGLRSLKCECQRDWRDLVSSPTRPIEERDLLARAREALETIGVGDWSAPEA